MENAVESIIIAFAVIVFVIALSLTTFMLSKAMTTTETLVYYSDETNYYENIKVNRKDITTREVSIDTVINSLYRYYKENFMVRIYNKTGELVQIFDTTLEGKIYSASGKISSKRTDEEKSLLLNFGSGKTANLFGAPWMGNTSKDAKARVDLYISGQKGYINNALVNYSGKGLKDLETNIFEETFIQYMYSGQTISTGEGDGIETITGNTKEKDKIIIDYKAIEE